MNGTVAHPGLCKAASSEFSAHEALGKKRCSSLQTLSEKTKGGAEPAPGATTRRWRSLPREVSGCEPGAPS